jgi:hypothetical protein
MPGSPWCLSTAGRAASLTLLLLARREHLVLGLTLLLLALREHLVLVCVPELGRHAGSVNRRSSPSWKY